MLLQCWDQLSFSLGSSSLQLQTDKLQSKLKDNEKEDFSTQNVELWWTRQKSFNAYNVRD